MSQTSTVDLCRQYSVISTRITCLYGSQPLSVIFAYKTATFGAEFQGFMGPRHDPSFCACKTAWLASELLFSMSPSPHLCFCIQISDFWTRITNLYWSQTSPVVLCMQYSVISTRNTCLYGSQPLSVVFACITATFGPEYKFSMGTRPHLSFLHAKQRLLDQNNKSLWVPDMTYRFVHVQQRA